MDKNGMERRDFLKALLAGLPLVALDWEAFPRGPSANESWDALIVGGGLGGLSCAAAFARQGFKALVLEQHAIAGGYATTFRRPGGFEFDVSLHSTSAGERAGIRNLIPGFPEISDVHFVPHKVLYRAIFPDHDLRVPGSDPEGYIKALSGMFPEEADGIRSLLAAMKGLSSDIAKYSRSSGKVDMATFPKEFPNLFQCYSRTWGDVRDLYIRNPKLKAIVSALWGYYGLPPSKLASLYYALPTWDYLANGGYYPMGRSQVISNALVRMIEAGGGRVMRSARVEKVLCKDRAAYGVRTADGREFQGRVVVANANARDLFHQMIEPEEYLKEYRSRLDSFAPSLSSFQVFLGLKKDLVRKSGITDTEIFYETGYDPEDSYRAALQADVEKGSFGLTLYDNLYPGYSPPGKNTMVVLVLQGYDHWLPYEADYFQGKKDAYRAEKERLARILVSRVEKTLMPGLSRAIEVMEIGTPLTNVRFTLNYRGAIYGWDQTLDNCSPRRLPHRTPVKNLYLAGAWTNPGGGYAAVIPSGLECFAQIMEDWKG